MARNSKVSRNLLLDYVESLTDEVAYLAPRIANSLQRLWPHLPTLLARIDATVTGLSSLEQYTTIRRGHGREIADWEAFRAWFLATPDRASEVDQLRGATMRALQSLLANAKRMIPATVKCPVVANC